MAVAEAKSSGRPEMPAGIRLMEWRPKAPPVAISVCSVVDDVPLFIQTTLWQLAAALQGDSWRAGNWPVRDLCERLEQVGVKVEVIK